MVARDLIISSWTSGHASSSSFRTRLVCSGVCGTSVYFCMKKKNLCWASTVEVFFIKEKGWLEKINLRKPNDFGTRNLLWIALQDQCKAFLESGPWHHDLHPSTPGLESRTGHFWYGFSFQGIWQAHDLNKMEGNHKACGRSLKSRYNNNNLF